MALSTSKVIEEFAAGRIDLPTAANSLRRHASDEGLSGERIETLLRANASRLGLSAAVADELLQAMSNNTQLRRPVDLTMVRQPVAGVVDSMTRLRDGTSQTQHAQDLPIPEQREFGEGSVIKSRFELKALVGHGGMGMVFRALDRRKIEANDPNPEVAVKILNAGFQHHPDAFVALQREASKAQSLAHPNIVTVFDFDRDENAVFITMELLRGSSLEDVISNTHRRGLDRVAALSLIRGIAQGLGYAHRKGIVHSDLKPANIFVGDDGIPKILDFGIARAVPTAGKSVRDQFDAGSLGAYTEAYATEEMVEGADPSPADDIYALGIIIHELLTGRHPFDGNTAAKARAAGLAAVPIRGLRRRERLTLARALSFDRAARPQDADEFLRQFFGATRLRNALTAATIVLAMAAGYLWYRNYEQSGPAIAFDALPAETQQRVKSELADGDTEWTFYRQGIGDALGESLGHFAKAYELHKGDRAAVRGLTRAADEMLRNHRADRQDLRDTASVLAQYSDFLKSYPPVREALGP